jgi:hypothetical protein
MTSEFLNPTRPWERAGGVFIKLGQFPQRSNSSASSSQWTSLQSSEVDSITTRVTPQLWNQSGDCSSAAAWSRPRSVQEAVQHR